MPDLILRLFGPPEVASLTGQLRIRRRQPLALLAYLALANGPVTRNTLGLLLFSECSDEIARSRIRRLLHELRHALQAVAPDHDVVQLRGDAVVLDHSRCEIDVRRFLSMVEADDTAAAAVTLYRGPLLDGFWLRDAPEFESWLHGERERIALLRAAALGRLARRALARGEWQQAAAYAQQHVAADPLDEGAHLRLMEAYAHQGEQRALQRQYEQLREILRRELDAAPLPDTQARYQELAHGRVAPASLGRAASKPLPMIPLVGRQRELQLLRDAARAARERLFHCVCVRGESGVGKTRLLDEALAAIGNDAERAGDERPIVVRVGCNPPPHTPYQALGSSLRALLPPADNPFARPLPASAAASSEPEQRLWEMLVIALQKVARADEQAAPRPLLVLAIDDAQWLDAATLRALPYLLRRLATPDDGAPATLLLIACRSDDQPAAVAALLRLLALQPAATTWVDLARLTAVETLALARAYSGAERVDGEFGALLERETEGNAFFLLEQLRDLEERGALARLVAGEQPRSPALPMPRSVRAAIEQRLLRLPAHAQQVIEGAAVLGQQVDADLLRAVLSVDEEALVDALERLEHAGLLRASDNEYSFCHNKVQAAVYDQLSQARRRLLHRRAAHALARLRNPRRAAALLAHAQRSHEWALAWAAARQAAAAARRAAAHAEALDFEHAALAALDAAGDDPALRCAVLLVCEDDEHLLGRRDQQAATLAALGRCAHTPELRAQMLYRNGRYLGALARWHEAQACLAAALDAAQEPTLRCAVRLELAQCSYHQGDAPTAVALARQALEAAGSPALSQCRLRAVMTLAWLAQMHEHADEAAGWLTQAQALAHGHPAVQAELWYMQARNRVRQGAFPQILRDATRGYEAAVAAGDVQIQAECLRLRGTAAGRLYRFGEAEAAYERARQLYGALHNPQGQAAVTLNLAILRYRIGDFSAALAATQSAHALALEIGDQRGQAIVAINLSAILIMLGDGAAAESWARAALDLCRALNLSLYRAFATTNLAGAQLRSGRAAEARDTLIAALALRPSDDIGRIANLSWLAYTCVLLGDLPAARRYSAQAVAALAANPGVDIPQQVYAVQAVVLRHDGDAPGAATALATATRLSQELLAHIPAPADRRRYQRSLAANRFIRAAARGDWASEHPLF